MADNRIYLTCAICGERLYLGGSLGGSGAYYENFDGRDLQERVDSLTAELRDCDEQRIKYRDQRDYYKYQLDYRIDQEQIFREGCEALEAERDKLKDRLEMDLGSMSGMELTIDKLTAERDQLSRDLGAEHALAMQLQDDTDRLRAERDELKNQVDNLTVERNLLQKAVNKLRRRVQGLCDFNEFLCKRDKQLESDLNEYRESLTECHAYCRYLQDKLIEYEKGKRK